MQCSTCRPSTKPACSATNRSDGFVAPARTPTEIIAKLNGAIVAALKDAAMQERTRNLGASPMPSSPPEFVRYIRSEL